MLVTNGSKNIAASAVTSTELGYLDGVTSAIQTQLNKKLTIANAYGTELLLNTSVYKSKNEDYLLRNYGIVQMCLSFYTKYLSGWTNYTLGTIASGLRPQFGIRFGQITEKHKTIYISIYDSGSVQMYIADNQLDDGDLVQFNTTWIL